MRHSFRVGAKALPTSEIERMTFNDYYTILRDRTEEENYRPVIRDSDDAFWRMNLEKSCDPKRLPLH